MAATAGGQSINAIAFREQSPPAGYPLRLAHQADQPERDTRHENHHDERHHISDEERMVPRKMVRIDRSGNIVFTMNTFMPTGG